MVKKLKKGSVKILLLLLSLSLLITPLGASSETAENQTEAEENTGSAADDTAEASDDYEKAVENNNLVMYLNKKTADFYVQDKKSNNIWRSTPETAKLPRLQSQVLIEYADKSNNAMELNSRVHSIKKKDFTVKLVENGVLITYTFRDKYVIPVQYTLLEDGLEASVKASEIKEDEEKPILTFSLLPFFGAGDESSKGYMVVPDGCGAVINYNNGKGNYESYKQDMYGRDDSIEVTAQISNTEDPKLPIFGVKNGEAAMLGVIHSGSSHSIVNAQIAGQASLNTVYTQFVYRDYGDTKFNSKKWDSKAVRLIEKSPAAIENYTMRYYFLSQDQADYTGMALRYQRYLQDEKKVETTIKENDYPFYLNLYGNIRKRDNFLGFPVYKDIALTTFKDTENILGQLKESGVDTVALKYSAWLKGGPDGAAPIDVKVGTALGGTKALNSLNSYMSSNNISGFYNLDLNGIYKDRYGYSRKTASAKGLNCVPAMQYRYKFSTYQINTLYDPLYLLKPTKVQSASKSVAARLKKLNVTGVSLDTLGNKLYSSFNEKGMSREDTKNIFTDCVQKLKESTGEVMMEAPNDYMLPLTTYVSSVPTKSSRYLIEDYEIPFYQMALHGITSYSMPSNNQTGDYRQSVLKALETGSSLQFTWIARNTHKIQGTPYDYLYSADYTSWMEEAVQTYNDISGVMKKVAAAKITKYDRLQDGVTKTSYDNGISILVNSTDKPVTVGSMNIEAMSYQVEEAKA